MLNKFLGLEKEAYWRGGLERELMVADSLDRHLIPQNGS